MYPCSSVFDNRAVAGRLGASELIDLPEQKTTPRESSRISRTKGHLSKRTAFVREIVKEVSG